MSGGHWDYANDTLAGEVLGYDYYFDYGLNSERHNKCFKKAVREHPLEDPEISALVFDVFCLLHSYDWAVSADTSMDDREAHCTDWRAQYQLHQARHGQPQQVGCDVAPLGSLLHRRQRQCQVSQRHQGQLDRGRLCASGR